LLLLPLVALGFAVAGCGGGSNSTKGGFETTTSATTTEATTGATTEATTEATTGATTEATTTSVPKGGASTKDCREFAGLSQKFSAALSGAANSQNLEKEADLLKEFASKAPSDIRDAFQTLADYMKKLADAGISLKPGQTPDPKTLAKLQKLATEIDQAKLSKAGTDIAHWVSQHCAGIGTSGSSGG
jgi:hypothetical protein